MILVFRCCWSRRRRIYRRQWFSPGFCGEVKLKIIAHVLILRLISWLKISSSSYHPFQLDSTQVDRSIDLTLGNFSDAAPLFETDTKQFIGITPYPSTPIATRQMPPAYPQPKQSSSAFNSNGLTSSSQSSVTTTNNNNNNISNSRTYNNNNNNTINNNNNNNSNTAINNVNNYQQKSSSSSILQLAPPPQSRASSNNVNNSSITASNSINNTFVRPTDNKPLINGGRSSYTNASQLKHEVNKTIFFSLLYLCFGCPFVDVTAVNQWISELVVFVNKVWSLPFSAPRCLHRQLPSIVHSTSGFICDPIKRVTFAKRTR